MVKVAVRSADNRTGWAGSDAKDGDMEASINNIGHGSLGRASVPPRPEQPPKRVAPQIEAPPAELAAWFDRNGDGRIDTTTWVLGGDAYLRVDKQVSEVLDRAVVRPRDGIALANEAAVNAYRKYGTTKDQRPRRS